MIVSTGCLDDNHVRIVLRLIAAIIAFPSHQPMHSRIRSVFAAAGVAALITAAQSACAPAPQTLSIVGETMGTSYSVKLKNCPTPDCLTELESRIERRLEQINNAMSTFDPQSELSRFNAVSGADWVSVSVDLYTVMAHAHAVSELTGGAFDVTVAPLVNAWGFGPEILANEQATADRSQMANLETGYERIELRDDPPGMRKQGSSLSIDLSGIAKGFGVDEIAELLDGYGIASYLVEIGGEVRGHGTRPDGKPWHIAVEHPAIGTRRLDGIVELADLSIATSGDYRNFYVEDGQRYSHTIDPTTAAPVRHGLASVSVVDPSAMHADAMATALMVLGPERGFALAQEHGMAAAFVVRRDDGYQQMMTPPFRRLLVD
jgi:thiamine biosynthesis lipoprotein